MLAHSTEPLECYTEVMGKTVHVRWVGVANIPRSCRTNNIILKHYGTHILCLDTKKMYLGQYYSLRYRTNFQMTATPPKGVV